MNDSLIWIVNTATQDEFNQQLFDWKKFASEYGLTITLFINIHEKSVSEIVEAVASEVKKHGTTRIGLESYKVLSRKISEALQIASLFVTTGIKIFTVSYANPPLVEIPNKSIYTMLKQDDFLDIEEDDLPFLISNHDATMQDLIFLLCGVKTTLETIDITEWSEKAIIGDIRHAILLAELIQNK
jgi:hypothetical protein